MFGSTKTVFLGLNLTISYLDSSSRDSVVQIASQEISQFGPLGGLLALKSLGFGVVPMLSVQPGRLSLT